MMHKLVLIPLLYYDNVIVYSINRNFFENILTVGHKIKIDGPAPPVMKSFVAQIQKKPMHKICYFQLLITNNNLQASALLSVHLSRQRRTVCELLHGVGQFRKSLDSHKETNTVKLT